MTFLVPWALAIGALAAAGMVVLHLVSRQRPAAYLLPTTRFVPNERTLVSRVATQPRDLLLLALRVLLVLIAAAAFAQPVLTPARGTIARVVLLDRSRAVANAPEAVARARALAVDATPLVIIAFDSVATVVASAAWDSLAAAPASGAGGSLSAALVAARRASVALAEGVDSVALIVVSPLAASTLDSATARLRAEWPGAVRLERVALRADSAVTWRLEGTLSASDPLGPATLTQRGDARRTRLVRAPFASSDSAFARAGGTVVRWDSASARRPLADGLAHGDRVIVASLGRVPIASHERTLARWADGSPAAGESVIGAGCLREVGVAQPAAGDIALHPPFQAIVRALLAPCGVREPDVAADSSVVARLVGTTQSAASAAVLRRGADRSSTLARWLLAAAIFFALVELAVRTRPATDDA